MTYEEIDEGGKDDGVETTEIRVSNKAAKEREERRNTDPSVDVFGGGGNGLVKSIGKVRYEIPRQT